MMRRWIAVGAAGRVLAYAVGAAATSPDRGVDRKSLRAERKDDRAKLRKPGDLKRERPGPKAAPGLRGRNGPLGALAADERARAAIAGAFSKTLGTTPEELSARRAAGTEIEAVLKEKGVTAEQLGAAVAAAVRPHLDRLVESKSLDRAAADAILAGITRGRAIGLLVRIAIAAPR
jgi:hypothetical protein